MITYNELKEKCTCWTGYKRKPGTKPCAEGSCVKEEKDTGGSGSEKHHVMAFGRMNPPTAGHEKLVDHMHDVAKKHNAGHTLVLSGSHGSKDGKNPLPADLKKKHAERAFPGTNVAVADKTHPTVFHHAAELHKQGVTHLHFAGGEDREAMHAQLKKYNNVAGAHGHYNFKDISFHNAGKRDEKAKGTEGISGTKLRGHVAAGEQDKFESHLSSKMKPEHKTELYHDLRKHMGVKEETTPYWKKPSFNKRMSQMAKQERLERERKEAEKKPVKEDVEQIDELNKDTLSSYIKKSTKDMEERKRQENIELNRSKQDRLKGKYGQRSALNKAAAHSEKAKSRAQNIGKAAMKYAQHVSKDAMKYATEETMDQQADHAKQLKRFKDQMTKLNGPNKETETEMDNLEKEIMMGKTDSSHGLIHNPDPMVDSHVRVGKIKHMTEKLDAHAGAGDWIHDFISSTNPRFNNKSKEERRKMAIGAYMAAKAKLKEDVQIDELSTELLGKYKTAAHASAKAADASGNYAKGDKRFKGINKATNKQFDNDLKKHGQLKEGNYEKAEENKRSADSAKEQGDMFAHHLHMADHHDNLAQWHSEKGRHGTADSHAKKSEEHHEKAMALKEGAMQPNGTDKIDTATSAPTASTAKDTTMGTKVKGFKFFKGENDKQMNMNQPVKEEVEELDEKSQQARRNKTYKNLMAASKGARVNRELGMTPADTGHKNNQQMNKAIGRAVTRGEVFEVATGNPGNGYHGQVQSPDDKYEATHKHVKNLTDGDDKTVKHYMDSTHGRHLAGREDDHEYIKKDFKKFKKYYKPEMHEAKAVNVDKVNHAGDKPHEEKWEPAKNVSKLKKESVDIEEGIFKGTAEVVKQAVRVPYRAVKRVAGAVLDTAKDVGDAAANVKKKFKEDTNMKSYKEFLQSLDEVKMADLPSRKIQGKSYGASYEDPEGADETAADMKKPEKKAAGRKAGQSTGSYKPRATMSKLKSAGATYK